MSSAPAPNETAQQKFVEKLDRFRSSLDADEQRMLDAVVAAARQAHGQGEVSVYWFMDGTETQPYGVTSNIWSSYGTPGGMGGHNTPFSS